MNTSRSLDDTIIALASGAGRAGVAVVRVSGPGAAGVLTQLGGAPVPRARKATIRVLRDNGAYLDEAIVLFMPGPNSFTGQDVVEFQVHGGPAVIEAVIAAALHSRICRLAEPGEFTRRAFENGRLDLTQAEAVADLIDAETEGQRRQAARIYQGEAAETFEGWRGQLISAMAALEAAIDFPDESDVPQDIDLAALAPIEALAAGLESALGDAGRLRSVR
jgi:tRNA modification GTPase